MKYRSFYILCTLLLCAGLAVAMVLPLLVDWNAYKRLFRAAIFETTGCHMSIDGTVELDLFPSPELNLHAVRLTEDSEIGAPGIMTIEQVTARFDLPTLLAGDVRIGLIQLVKPSLLVAAGEKKLCDETAPGLRLLTGGQSEEANGDTDGRRFSVKRIEILGGLIPLKRPGQEKFLLLELDHLDLEIFQQRNRAKIAGQARIDDTVFSLDLNIASIINGTPPVLDGYFEIPALNGQVKLTGSMTQPLMQIGKLRGAFNGNISFEADDSQAIFSKFLPGEAVWLKDIPLRFYSDIQITSRSIGLNNYSFVNGPFRGNGTASIAFGERPFFDISYRAKTLDLDEIIARTPGRKTVKAPMPAGGNPAQITADFTGQSVIMAPGLPTGSRGRLLDLGRPFERVLEILALDMSLDMTVETVKYLGGVVREAGFHATFGDGSFMLDRASAIFPGGAELSLFGFIDQHSGTPRFDGRVTLHSDDFKRFLGWAGVAENLSGQSRLHRLILDSEIGLTADLLHLEGFDLRLDSSRITGDGRLFLNRSGPLASLSLKADKLNLDAYSDLLPAMSDLFLRQDKIFRQDEKPLSRPGTSAFGALLKTDDARPTPAGAYLPAVELTAEIEDLMLLGQPVGRGKIELISDENRLVIRSLYLENLAGISANAGGRIVFDPANDDAIKIDLALTSDDLSAAFSRLNSGDMLQHWGHRLGSVKGRVKLRGSRGDLTIDTDFSSAGHQLRLFSLLSQTGKGIQIGIRDGTYRGDYGGYSDIEGRIVWKSPGNLEVDGLALSSETGIFQLARLVLHPTAAGDLKLSGKGRYLDDVVKGLPIGLTDFIRPNGRFAIEYQFNSKGRDMTEVWEKIQAEGDLTGRVSLHAAPHAGENDLQQALRRLQDFLAKRFGHSPLPLEGNIKLVNRVFTGKGIRLTGRDARMYLEGLLDLKGNRLEADLDIREKSAESSYLSVRLDRQGAHLLVRSRGRWIAHKSKP